MAVNDFLPFCPTDTGTNLLSESDYTAAADRTSGNKPGVASSRLNNKALRQANAITSQVAQYISNKTGTDVLDDANSVKLLAQIGAAITPLPPVFTRYTSGSATHNLSYIFFIASGSATAGATYTNNGVTYTVSATVSSALQVTMKGNGSPTVAGTLTKASGTGDATLTFYAMRAPLYLIVTAQGGGGGGAGGGSTNGTAPTAGGNTTLGGTVVVANGGSGNQNIGSDGGAGGTASIGTGASGGILLTGQAGGSAGGNEANGTTLPGPTGGQSPFSGAGTGGSGGAQAGKAATPGTGSGGGGSGSGGNVNGYTGPAGGAGGYAGNVMVLPSVSLAYVIGASGSAGGAGTGGAAGGLGATGFLHITECYQ